ncbi:hypothetical protein P3S68_008473 [Capsicum galapagoense]
MVLVVVIVVVALVVALRDLEELPEQSQSGKSEAEERCENNIEGGGQGSVDGESEKEKELESEKEKEDDHQHDDNGSPMGRELISTSQHNPIKTFSIDRFQKMNEIWINYCGMPICFGLQEFTIVTGLRFHCPKGPPPRKRSKARKYKEKINRLFDIARRGYKASDLLTDLKDKTIPEQYKDQLCLVWFAHSVILARDVNKVIEVDLLARAEDFDKLNNYPWGYDNFNLTVQYLLTKLSSGTTTLYGFPWAFMAWAFEAIPPLRKQLMDYPDEVSYSRMFRWLAAKSNTNIKEFDLFNPPDDAVVHPWIVPTEEESVMTSYITLGYVDTIEDPMVELIKKELVRATTIRRAVRQGQPNVEALHDQLFIKADPGASSTGVIGVGGRHADACTTHDDDYGPVKKVDIYAELGAEEKRDLRQAKNAKPGAPDYPRPPFFPKTSRL